MRTLGALYILYYAQKRIFLIFGIVLLLFSCKKEVFPINEEVSIGFNSTILIETTSDGQMDIQYVELLDESRCPPGTNCVWAGYVNVKLKLDDEQFVELGLGGSIVDSVAYNNHVVKLLSVEYDSDDDFGKEKKSSVVIRVD